MRVCFEIPTLAEVLDLVKKQSKRLGRTIGVAPETKHPTYFDSIGLSMEEPLVRTLDEYGLDGKRDKVVLQSVEIGNLQDLDEMTDVPIAQLVDAIGAPYDQVAAGSPTTYASMATAAGLKKIATYADWVAPHKDRVLPRDSATGVTDQPSTLVEDAHRTGLRVVIWTIRDENQFMATNFRHGTDPNAKGHVDDEITAFLDAGIDALFADYPDTAVSAREEWLED